MNEKVSGDTLATRAGRAFIAYRDGDDSQMADLVKMLTPIMWNTARATRLDACAAEDVLQSVWLALVSRAATIHEPMAILKWLVTTTKREAWRVSGIQARTRPEDLEHWQIADPESSAMVEDEVMRRDSQARLWQHIEQLPERSRALLRVIAYADRPDYAALAAALGMPQGSIGPTRGRCLAKLRVELEKDDSFDRPASIAAH